MILMGGLILSAATTKDAIAEGYRTMLVDNGCRGVCDSDMEATKETITALNGLIINSSQVLRHSHVQSQALVSFPSSEREVKERSNYCISALITFFLS